MSALSLQVSALSLQMSALSLQMSALNLQMSALSLQMSALSLQMSALNLQMSALSLQMSAFSLQMSALSLQMSALCAFSHPIQPSTLPLPTHDLSFHTLITAFGTGNGYVSKYLVYSLRSSGQCGFVVLSQHDHKHNALLCYPKTSYTKLTQLFIQN